MNFLVKWMVPFYFVLTVCTFFGLYGPRSKPSLPSDKVPSLHEIECTALQHQRTWVADCARWHAGAKAEMDDYRASHPPETRTEHEIFILRIYESRERSLYETWQHAIDVEASLARRK